MKLLKKVKMTFLSDDPETNTTSTLKSREDARVNAGESSNTSHGFSDRRLQDLAVATLGEIRDECFPNQVQAFCIDASNEDVDRLIFKAVAPQGLTVSIDALGSELDKAKSDVGLKKFLKEKMSEAIISFIGNLELQESEMPTFITSYGLQYDRNLTYFHINEDLLATAGMNMYFSLRLDDYPVNNSSSMQIFSQNDLNIVREVIFKIQDKLGLKHIAPLKGIVPASNGFFVDIVTLQLESGKGHIQLTIYPDQKIVDCNQKANIYYSDMLDSFNKNLDISPRKAMVKYHNGFKDMTFKEVSKELSQLKELVKSLPDTYDELD